MISTLAGILQAHESDNEELTYKELLDIGEQIVFELNIDQIQLIEVHTRAQHGCDLWFKHRAGQITTSKMKAVCHTDSTNLSQSLIKRICYPELFTFNSKQTEWGRKLEYLARQEYVKAVKKDHQNLQVSDSGLFYQSNMATHWSFT